MSGIEPGQTWELRIEGRRPLRYTIAEVHGDRVVFAEMLTPMTPDGSGAEHMLSDPNWHPITPVR